jgi:hypothetical protein
MCNINPVKNLLIATMVAILAAGGAVITAAVSNNSFWGALGSVGIMITAGILTAVALGLLWATNNALNAFCSCLAGRCQQACSNLSHLLAGAGAVLGIQVGACFAAAGIAWIPWAGQGPMWVIAGTLLIEVALIMSGLVFINALSSCGQQQPS